MLSAVRDDEDSDSFSHAADEPTAMWNEESLQELALAPPSKQQESRAATKGGSGGPSVEVSLGPASGQRSMSKVSGLSWGVTILLALGLGAGVYYLIRFLKG